MRNILLIALSVLALISFQVQAGPSFRILQDINPGGPLINATNGTVNPGGPFINVSNGNNPGGPIINETNNNAVNNSSKKSNNSATANHSASNLPGFHQLKIADIKANSSTNAALLWGFDYFIQLIISERKIPYTLYNLTHLNQAWWRNITDGIEYYFGGRLVGADGVVVDANITISHNNNTGNNSLLSYNFVDHNEHSNEFPPNGYTALVPEQFANDSVIHDALAYGVKYIVQYLCNEGKIPQTSLNYTVLSSHQPAYRRNGSLFDYLFEIQAQNTEGLDLSANYTVQYSRTTLGYNMLSYNYQASNYTPPFNISNTTGPINLPLILYVNISEINVNPGNVWQLSYTNTSTPLVDEGFLGQQ